MLLQNLYYQIVAKVLCEHSPIQEKSDSFGSLFVVISQASRDNQPAKPQNYKATKQQDNKTTKQPNFVWKTIPSIARVTRDGVSGL